MVLKDTEVKALTIPKRSKNSSQMSFQFFFTCIQTLDHTLTTHFIYIYIGYTV